MEFPREFSGIISRITSDYQSFNEALEDATKFCLGATEKCKGLLRFLIDTCNRAERSIDDITKQIIIAEDTNAPPLTPIRLESAELTVYRQSDAQYVADNCYIGADYNRYIEALEAVWVEYEHAGWHCTKSTDLALSNFKQQHKIIVSILNKGVEHAIPELPPLSLLPPTGKLAPVRCADSKIRDVNGDSAAPVITDCNTAFKVRTREFPRKFSVIIEAIRENYRLCNEAKRVMMIELKFARSHRSESLLCAQKGFIGTLIALTKKIDYAAQIIDGITEQIRAEDSARVAGRKYIRIRMQSKELSIYLASGSKGECGHQTDDGYFREDYIRYMDALLAVWTSYELSGWHHCDASDSALEKFNREHKIIIAVLYHQAEKYPIPVICQQNLQPTSVGLVDSEIRHVNDDGDNNNGAFLLCNQDDCEAVVKDECNDDDGRDSATEECNDMDCGAPVTEECNTGAAVCLGTQIKEECH